MPRRKSTNRFNDYIRVGEPDKEAISILTKKAIGARSLSEFASLTGISKSTLSRIISQKFKTPSSIDVIAAIATHASIDSNVTKEMLFTAHGLAPLTITATHDDTIELTRAAISTVNGLQFERIVQSILQENLLELGYNLSQKKDENVISIPSLRYKADFLFDTTTNFHNNINKWAFDIHMSNVRPILHKLSWVFGMLYLDSLIEKNMKFSLVIDNNKDFEEVKSRFADVRIDDLVSIILINISERSIVDEFFIPTKKNIEYLSVFKLQTQKRSEVNKDE